MTFIPERPIRVEVNKRDKEYNEIRTSPRSPFKDIMMKDIFLMAMAMGKHRQTKSQLKGTGTHDLFRTGTLNPEEEWLIKSVAIDEDERLENILDDKDILKVAEEYANAGILYLYDLIFNSTPGAPLKKIEAEASDIYPLLNLDEE